MEAVLETDHRLPAGEVPGHLDRVLHRLGAAIKEERPFLVVPRRDPIESFRQLDVGLVGGYREADVGKPVELLPHRLDHSGMAVAGVDHTDSAPEVDQAVAIGIGEHRSVRVDHGDRGHRRHAPGHRLGPPGQQGTALGAGNLGLETDDARHRFLEKGKQQE